MGYAACLNENFNLIMGINITSNEIFSSSIIYSVSQCRNSTDNNNSCASAEEILKMSKNVYIQASIPKTIFDFKNPSNSRKRSYDYNYYFIDINLKMYLATSLMPISFYTDHGYFSENYELESIDFNMDTTQEYHFARDTDMLFEQEIQISFNEGFHGFNQQIYYKQNENLYTILSNLGGIANLLFTVGKIICSFYNLLLMKHKLINISFSNINKDESTKRDSFYAFNITFTTSLILVGRNFLLILEKNLNFHLARFFVLCFRREKIISKL